ncbi:MAG: hypothetical protein FWG53_07460 [Clostridiales bacterium]|nr:hypothetical protein [Clostridiales bacterium]
MKRIIPLVLAVVLTFGLTGAYDAEAGEKSGPEFNATFAILSDSAWAIKQDGTLWVWMAPTDQNTHIQWPSKAADHVAAIDRNFPYGLLVETPKGLLMADRYGDSGSSGITPDMEPVKVAESKLSWYDSWDCGDVAWRRWYIGERYDGSEDYIYIGLNAQGDGSFWYFEIMDNPYKSDELLLDHGDINFDLMDRKLRLIDDGLQSYHVIQKGGPSDPEGNEVFMLCEDGTLWHWDFPATFGGKTGQPQKILDEIDSLIGDIGCCFAMDKNGAIWDCYGDHHVERRPSEFPRIVIEDVAVFTCDLFSRAAIKTDRSLWTWGRNSNAEFQGDYKETPALIMENAVDVKIDDYILALKSDGSLWMWGGGNWNWGNFERNLFPAQTDRATPQKIMDNVAINVPSSMLPSTWAKDEIKQARVAGLVPAGIQSWYQNDITRAEFCALGVALFEKVTGGIIADRVTFADTSDANVEKMAAVGVVNGTSPDEFTPKGTYTREQSILTILRAFNYIME